MIAIVMVLGFSALGFAQNVTSSAAPIGTQTGNLSAAYGSQAGIGPIGNGEVICATGEMYTGQVAWTDQDTHRIMVSGYDGKKIFDVSGVATNGLPGADQFVTVRYTVVNGERVASSVTPLSRQVAWIYTPIYG